MNQEQFKRIRHLVRTLEEEAQSHDVEVDAESIDGVLSVYFYDKTNGINFATLTLDEVE